MAAGYGTSPFFVFSGVRRRRRVLPVRRAALRRASRPGTRPTGSTGTRGGRSSARRRPSTPRATTPCGSRATSRPATRAAPGFHRGGTGIEKTYVFTGPGAFTVNDDRATIPPWGINGGRHGGCSTKTLIRAIGRGRRAARRRSTRFPSAPATRLVFRTAGAGGWGDPLERDPQLVLRDVLRDLVSHEAAIRDYGVVVDGDRRRRRGHRGRARTTEGRARARPAVRLRPRTDGRTPHDDQPSLTALRARRRRRTRCPRRPHREDRGAGGYRGALPRRLRDRRSPLRPARRRPDRPRRGRRERAPHARGDRASDRRRRRHRLRLRGRRLADGARARGRRGRTRCRSRIRSRRSAAATWRGRR